MALHSSVLTAAGVLVLAMGMSEAAAQTLLDSSEQDSSEQGSPDDTPRAAADDAGAEGTQASREAAEVMPAVDGRLPETSRIGTGQEPGTAGGLQFAQMLKEAKGIQGRLDQLAEDVSHLLRDARDAADVIQQMCLDDSLNQVDVAGQSAGENVALMESAAAAGDTTEVQKAYSVMQALGEGANALSTQANDCIGERKKFVGGASLNVTMDPAIPRGDATGGTIAVPVTAAPITVEIQPLPPSVSPVM